MDSIRLITGCFHTSSFLCVPGGNVGKMRWKFLTFQLEKKDELLSSVPPPSPPVPRLICGPVDVDEAREPQKTYLSETAAGQKLLLLYLKRNQLQTKFKPTAMSGRCGSDSFGSQLRRMFFPLAPQLNGTLLLSGPRKTNRSVTWKCWPK